MLVRAADLRVGDVIQEKGYRGKISRTRVETVRKGGHVPHRYKRKDGPTIPVTVSPTPTRLQPYASVVVNEQWSYPWTAWVTVLRGEEEVQRVASAEES